MIVDDGVPIDSRPGKLGGKTCIAGTRLPVTTLFSHLATGGTVASFAESYGVSKDKVGNVLLFAGRDMVRDPHVVERATNDLHERMGVKPPTRLWRA